MQIEVRPASNLSLLILLRRGRVRSAGQASGGGALAALRHDLAVDICIMNGENAADGVGLAASSRTGSSRPART